MSINLRFIALFLVATGMFAQRGGGFRGGSMPGFGHPSFVGHRIFMGANPGSFGNFGNGAIIPRFPFGSVRSGSNARFLGYRFGLNRRFVSGFFGLPYYPFVANYGDGCFPANDYYQAVRDDIAPKLSAPEIVPPPPPPPQPAHPVIHEYKWNDEAVVVASDQVTFTIALRDGSTLSGATTWVQDGKLHYIDSAGKPGVLSPDLIDRDTTQRLNQKKNLHINLPPD